MASTGLAQLLSDNGGKCGSCNTSAIERMDVTMDMSDNPPPEELNARVAALFNQIFAPEPAVDASQVSLQHMSGAMTNYVYIATIDPEPTVPTAQAPRMMRTAVNSQQQDTTLMPRKYIIRVYGTGLDEIL
ncbi:hypothetical protein GGI22_008110, partial [Coemansia erecta]